MSRTRYFIGCVILLSTMDLFTTDGGTTALSPTSTTPTPTSTTPTPTSTTPTPTSTTPTPTSTTPTPTSTTPTPTSTTPTPTDTTPTPTDTTQTPTDTTQTPMDTTQTPTDTTPTLTDTTQTPTDTTQTPADTTQTPTLTLMTPTSTDTTPTPTETTPTPTLMTTAVITTTGTVVTTTNDPLKTSYPIGDLLMYIPSHMNFSLKYNETLKQNLTKDFETQMDTILKDLRGYENTEVTEIRKYTSSSRKRSVADVQVSINYNVVLRGDTILTETLNSTPDLPKNITLLNTHVTVKEWGNLTKAIIEANEKLFSDTCSVFKNVDKCRAGYNCKLESTEVSCIHQCRYENKCGEKGDCYFDELSNQTHCRCKEDGGRYYTGPDCSVEAYKLALPLGAVIGINAGLGGALLLVILVLAIRIIRNRKETRGIKESSYKLSGFERGRESPRELKHYDDLWQHRQWRTESEGNSFSERPYMATQDSLGNPMYMYRPDDRNEQPYTELNSGSSLSNLNLPESKFEIRRPKIVIGR